MRRDYQVLLSSDFASLSLIFWSSLSKFFASLCLFFWSRTILLWPTSFLSSPDKKVALSYKNISYSGQFLVTLYTAVFFVVTCQKKYSWRTKEYLCLHLFHLFKSLFSICYFFFFFILSLFGPVLNPFLTQRHHLVTRQKYTSSNR